MLTIFSVKFYTLASRMKIFFFFCPFPFEFVCRFAHYMYFLAFKAPFSPRTRLPPLVLLEEELDQCRKLLNFFVVLSRFE